MSHVHVGDHEAKKQEEDTNGDDNNKHGHGQRNKSQLNIVYIPSTQVNYYYDQNKSSPSGDDIAYTVDFDIGSALAVDDILIDHRDDVEDQSTRSGTDKSIDDDKNNQTSMTAMTNTKT